MNWEEEQDDGRGLAVQTPHGAQHWWRMGLEEPAGLDGPHTAASDWWVRLPGGLPWGSQPLRAPGPMGPGLSLGLPATLRLQCLRAKNQYKGPRRRGCGPQPGPSSFSDTAFFIWAGAAIGQL